MVRIRQDKAGRRRQPLSAEVIAREAMALIDESGIDDFSYRKLAKRLHCEAMSLYTYFASKAHLMDELVDICVDETPVPPDDLPQRERIRRFAHAFRETALRHPGFSRHWITHRLNHRKALAWLDQVAGMFMHSGLSTERQAHLFRTFSNFVMGVALDETSGYARGPSAAIPVPDDEAMRDFPAIIGIGAYFGTDHHRPMFETGLEVLLGWFQSEIDAAEARQARTRA